VFIRGMARFSGLCMLAWALLGLCPSFGQSLQPNEVPAANARLYRGSYNSGQETASTSKSMVSRT